MFQVKAAKESAATLSMQITTLRESQEKLQVEVETLQTAKAMLEAELETSAGEQREATENLMVSLRMRLIPLCFIQVMCRKSFPVIQAEEAIDSFVSLLYAWDAPLGR